MSQMLFHNEPDTGLHSPDVGKHPALLLNADYQPVSYFPLSVLSWQQAVRQVLDGDVDVLSEYDTVVRSPSVSMRLPSVVALRRYVPVMTEPKFTRRNVMALRDRYTCQYCGERFPGSELTFEHVIPRSRGGKTTWENILTACLQCNGAKKDLMPDRSGGLPVRMVNGKRLRMIRWPHRPTARELWKAGRELGRLDVREDWLSWLYWETPLDP